MREGCHRAACEGWSVSAAAIQLVPHLLLPYAGKESKQGYPSEWVTSFSPPLSEKEIGI